MFNFDEKHYLEVCNNACGLRKEVENLADKLSKKGFENLFFIASGGSLAVTQTFEYIWKNKSKIPVYSEIAAEIVLTDNKQLTENSLVILQSKSGDTKETVAAARYLKERGITTVGIVRVEGSPLDKACDYSIIETVENFAGSDPENIVLYYLLFRLLYNNGEFEQYNKFADEVSLIPEAMVDVRKQSDSFAHDFAEKYKDEPYQLWIGAGSLFGKTYSYAMCVLEEMQWIKSKSIQAAEYFHGTLEIVEKDTCVVSIKGEDECRVLSERVERFTEKYTDKFTVIDTKDYIVKGLSDEFRVIVGQLIVTAVVDRISVYLEKMRNHSLDIRRYYRVLEY
ncbi:MAG: SIS domain-containing protein [Clostridium sp.]|uniref:Fructosamine deglycase FrlB n=1 Tax=Clostridium paraputrificum TaxID=29363 RepID=A0A6N3GQ52_9CLOT|nr:SIS domain-containing protein [Clostridium sp.]MBS5926557.1 SIS domain-containing protein [Clostridium sp.]